MVFVGYELGTESYCCLDPLTFKLHISRDMIFEQSKVWNWDFKKIEDKGGEFKLTTSSDLNYEDVSVKETYDSVTEIPREGSVEQIQIAPDSAHEESRRYRSIQELYEQKNLSMQECFISLEESVMS